MKTIKNWIIKFRALRIIQLLLKLLNSAIPPGKQTDEIEMNGVMCSNRRTRFGSRAIDC